MNTNATYLFNSAVNGTYPALWTAYSEKLNISATRIRQVDPEHRDSLLRILSSGPDLSQVKPPRLEEVTMPILDHRQDVESVKPKRKSRPLPPLPVAYPQLMPRDEATYTKEAPHQWLIPNTSQSSIDTGYQQPTSLPFGWFGEPIFTRPALSSRPLPQPPIAFTSPTKEEVYDDFLNESYEQWVGEMDKHRSVMQWLHDCEVAPDALSWEIAGDAC